MDGYPTILSFPGLLQATCFHKSQSLQWQLLSAATYKWPTLLRQEWKMTLGAVQMVVREQWCQNQHDTWWWPPPPHLQKEPSTNRALAMLSATDLNQDCWHPLCWWVLGPGLPTLNCLCWGWSSKNCVGLEWKDTSFGIRQIMVWNHCCHLLSCAALSKPPNFSEPHFLICKMELMTAFPHRLTWKKQR